MDGQQPHGEEQILSHPGSHIDFMKLPRVWNYWCCLRPLKEHNKNIVTLQKGPAPS
jgi:hypothetical protein